MPRGQAHGDDAARRKRHRAAVAGVDLVLAVRQRHVHVGEQPGQNLEPPLEVHAVAAGGAAGGRGPSLAPPPQPPLPAPKPASAPQGPPAAPPPPPPPPPRAHTPPRHAPSA